MAHFIDRNNELTTLTREYNRKSGSFVILYGRRRLGKTTLIREFCKNKKHIYFLVTEESENSNLQSFKSLVAEELDNSLLGESDVKRWETVFDVIAEKCNSEHKLILAIDEFQYLGKKNPAFPSILMKIWDTKLKEKNIMLILSGSLISMIAEQALNYGSPLYGRRTAQIKLKQIQFKYYKDFFPSRSIDECIQRYAVTGGVPKYIELFSDNDDIYDAIQHNIISNDSFLYAEPDFLLQKEVKEIGSYFSVLKMIATGKQKASEIAAAAEIKQTSLSKYLGTLSDLDLIKREVPVTEDKPEKSKKGKYIITDNFIKFWFLFVYPYQSMLEMGKTDYVMDKISDGFIKHQVAYVYEDICREKMYDMIGEFADYNIVGRWWGQREIDIVAYDSTGDDIVFGECKYSTNPKGFSVFKELVDKTDFVNWKNDTRKEHYIIFSRSGFDLKLIEYSKDHPELKLVEGV